MIAGQRMRLRYSSESMMICNKSVYKPQHRMAKIVTLLACVGALGVAMEASAQTVTYRLGTPPFAGDGLTMETAPTLYNAPHVQRPVGLESQDRRDLDRFHLLAAAERSAGGGGRSGTAPSDGPANAAELAKNPKTPSPT
jgi:hypothetical protein